MENGQKIKNEHRLTKLEADVKYIREEQDKNHRELMVEFKELRKKVNEEITTMQLTIKNVHKNMQLTAKNNREFILKVLAIALLIGSFFWIQESRDYFLRLLGFII